MKHPSSEDWMALLYGEAPARQRVELETHLAQCRRCAEQVDDWRRGMKALNAWPPEHRARGHLGGPVLKWAAAAAVVIGLGFAAGRYSAPSAADATALRATLQHEVQQQIEVAKAALAADWQQREQLVLAASRTAAAAEAERLLGEFVLADAAQRTTDLQTIYAAMKQLESRRQQEHTALRRELETVAVLTQNSLVQLAGYQPAGSATTHP